LIRYYQFEEKCRKASSFTIDEYFNLLISFLAFEDGENETLNSMAKQDFQEYFDKAKKNLETFNKQNDNQFGDLMDDLIQYLLNLDNEKYEFIQSQVDYTLTRMDDMVKFVHRKESAPELLDADEVKDHLKHGFPRDYAILRIMIEISMIQEGYKPAVEMAKKIKHIYDEKIARWLKDEFDSNRSKRFINFLLYKQQKNLTFTKRELRILFKYNFKYFLGHPTPEEIITITTLISSCVADLKVLKPNTIFFSKSIYFLLDNYKSKLITAKDLKDIYRFMASRYITFDTIDEKGADSSLKEILDFCMNSIFQELP